MKNENLTADCPEIGTVGWAGRPKAFSNLLLYRSSHDFCAPLKSISGLLNVIEQTDDNALSGQCLDLMLLSIEKMQSLLQEVDQLVNNEERMIITSPITFSKLMENMLPALKGSMRDNEIDLTTTITQSTDFFTDRGRIQFTLLHILSNAITFRDENKEKLLIDVTITTNETFCVITVKDNGIGMNKFIQSKMFQPFFRGSERSKGAGLGLFVVNNMIDKLGGKIKVSSQPGVGSTFTVSVPNCLA